MSKLQAAARFVLSMLDPMVWLHAFRILHFYGYSHVRERRRMRLGPRVRIAPNISIRNGERITVGADAHLGERCSLWAGDRVGRITVGEHALVGPDVYVTASNYCTDRPGPMVDHPKQEQDVHIGAFTWLGRGVIVLPGVTIGDGTIVAAGSVVNRDLPPDVIAGGMPARILRSRFPHEVGGSETLQSSSVSE